MEITYISFAGFSVAVRFHTPRFPRLCSYFKNDFIEVYKDFSLPHKPKKVNFTINIQDQSTIQVIKLPKKDFHTVHFFKNQSETALTTYYHIGIYQFQVIMRMVSTLLLSKKNGFMFHSSASLIDGKVHVFLAKSGGGKSTIMKLLHPTFSAYADDTLIVMKEGKSYLAYQTPFIEKEAFIQKQSKGYPIRKIYFLQKKPFTSIKEMKNKKILAKKLYQSIWFDLESRQKNLSCVGEFLNHFHDYSVLNFTKDKNEVGKFLSKQT